MLFCCASVQEVLGIHDWRLFFSILPSVSRNLTLALQCANSRASCQVDCWERAAGSSLQIHGVVRVELRPLVTRVMVREREMSLSSVVGLIKEYVQHATTLF